MLSVAAIGMELVVGYLDLQFELDRNVFFLLGVIPESAVIVKPRDEPSGRIGDESPPLAAGTPANQRNLS
jgi:hypothetical protein